MQQNTTNQLEPISQKLKFNYKIVLIVFLAFLLIIGSLFVFLQKENKLSSRPTSAIQLTPETNEVKKPVFPVKIFDPVVDGDTAFQEGSPAPCQPEFFDPKISKFYKVKQNDGTFSEYYKLEEGGEGVFLKIYGSDKEGKNKIILPSPFSVTLYDFGCASSVSYVIDLMKNGKRQALYTHVLFYSFSKDGKKLYLVNNIKKQGTWTLHKRIIDIETKEVHELPNIGCVHESDIAATRGFWQNDRLLTYAENRNRSDYQTDICIWDKSGKLISRIGTNSIWGSASRGFLAEKIGLLPTNSDIFYAYTSKDEDTCSLFLVDINKKDIFKPIDILDKRNYQDLVYYCASPDVEFDFSEFYFDHGVLKYRIEKERRSSGEIIWSNWKNISLTNQ